MDDAGGDQRFDDEARSKEQSPSLLTVVLDTNPAAWALLQETLSLSQAIASLLIFINAHLACNYTNHVAVIASHCDKAQWLYPTSTLQKAPGTREKLRMLKQNGTTTADAADEARPKRVRLNGEHGPNDDVATTTSTSPSNKYRPFRLVEEELLRNLNNLLVKTIPSSIQEKTSTVIAGALTLALSYINRKTAEHNESLTGTTANLTDISATATATTSDSTTANALTNSLQSRILLITLSPSTDLAHQYIPIMNSIFACQRLNIPIDVLQLPLPGATHSTNQNSTVFLQQAADATRGIFIPAQLYRDSSTSSSTSFTQLKTKTAPQALLTYLLSAFLPNPSTRVNLILPTRIDVDFRAACFCHRNVISIGYVCSICLSIFCEESLAELSKEGTGCLTCGTSLKVGDYGNRPIVVARRRRKKKKGVLGGDSRSGTPGPGSAAA